MKTVLAALNIVLISTCLQASPTPKLVSPILPVFRQPYGNGDATKIVNGQEAAVGQFPFQAALLIDSRAFCGGSLISPNWVLTAGHCVDGSSSWTVTLGAHNYKDATEAGRVSVLSRDATRHEDYDEETLDNDVAVVHISKAVTLTDHIQPVKLAPASDEGKNFAGTAVRVSGWGKPSDSATGISPILRFVDLSIITQDDCADTFGDIITEKIYCCSGAGGKGTCSGDSGGPLTVGAGENVTQVGIVSFGSAKGCSIGLPSGFTAVPYQAAWISETTGLTISDESSNM